jgi:predicted methyltransferase MtxX (methanogen marker protein 4)
VLQLTLDESVAIDSGGRVELIDVQIDCEESIVEIVFIERVITDSGERVEHNWLYRESVVHTTVS